LMFKEGAHGGTLGSPVPDQVEPRRDFIEKNAKDVKFLDV
jgi:DNA gyrase/topoisomerase IV subunit B